MKTQREDILKDIVRKSYEVRSTALHEAKKDEDQFTPPPPPAPVAAPSPSAIGGKGGAGASIGARAGGAIGLGSVKKAKVFQLAETFADLAIGATFFGCPSTFRISEVGEERTYPAGKADNWPVYERFKDIPAAEAAKVANPALQQPTNVKFQEEVPAKGLPTNEKGEFINEDELEKVELPAFKKDNVFDEVVVPTKEIEEANSCPQSQNQYRKTGANSAVMIKNFNEKVEQKKKLA